jgi:hypothetical protein
MDAENLALPCHAYITQAQALSTNTIARSVILHEKFIGMLICD